MSVHIFLHPSLVGAAVNVQTPCLLSSHLRNWSAAHTLQQSPPLLVLSCLGQAAHILRISCCPLGTRFCSICAKEYMEGRSLLYERTTEKAERADV